MSQYVLLYKEIVAAAWATAAFLYWWGNVIALITVCYEWLCCHWLYGRCLSSESMRSWNSEYVSRDCKFEMSSILWKTVNLFCSAVESSFSEILQSPFLGLKPIFSVVLKDLTLSCWQIFVSIVRLIISKYWEKDWRTKYREWFLWY